MPYFLAEGKSIYDTLREPKFHLLTFSDGEGDYQTESEFARTWAHVLDHHIVPLYPHVAEVFGVSKPFTVLLRPDNYIGFISAETSSSRVMAYLQHLGTITA